MPVSRTRGLAAAMTAAASLALATSAGAATGGAGTVYAQTNDPGGNAVATFARAGDGTLTAGPVVATGGAGSGAGLGSQGSVVVDETAGLLFAVNAGSDSVSAFRVADDGLRLASTAPSGGDLPTSVTYRDGLLYVLNAGAPNSISALAVAPDGTLAPLTGSTRPLSGDQTAPAQVGFAGDGSALVVTERATNRIDTFTLGADGRATGRATYASAGPTPFGFAVDKRGTLFVSEAGAGGGASSYRLGDEASLTRVSSMVMTGQRAACWAVVTSNGRFGYVANAGTGNVSGFAIGADGSATLLDADGVTAATGGNPTDTALSRNSRFLYTRVGALGEIAAFAIASDGSLRALPALTGVPASYAGLAAT